MLKQRVQVGSNIGVAFGADIFEKKTVKKISDESEKANEDKSFRVHHLVKFLSLNKAVCRVHAGGL